MCAPSPKQNHSLCGEVVCEELKVFAVMKHVECGLTHGPDSGGCCVTPRLFNGSLLPVIDLDNVTLRLQHLSAAS